MQLASLVAAGLLAVTIDVAAQTEIPVAGVTGDQLIFFFDARTNRVPFLSVSNPSAAAVTVDVALYPASLASPLGRTTVSIPAAGNVIIDPTEGDLGAVANGQAGLAIVTPVSGGGSLVPVVPPRPLAGSFTLANTALQAAFGENALGRLAVNEAGSRAAAGATIDGTTVRYQRLAPAVLTIPTYFNPQSLASPAQDGNRVVLAAFGDAYGTTHTATPASRDLTATFFSGSGTQITAQPVAVSGVRLTNLQEIAAGVTLDSSGKVFFAGPAGAGNLLGLFSQSLGTFASGQRMPAVGSVPAPGPSGGTSPTPTPSLTPSPTATPASSGGLCGNGAIDGDEECDGADFGGQDCFEVVGGSESCSGTLACSASCKLVVSGCSCACESDFDCQVPVDCNSVVAGCELDGACVGGTCFVGSSGNPAICNGRDPDSEPEDPTRCEE